MTTAAFQNWLEAYRHAWEQRDPDAALRIFTSDASYQETPFEEPMRGSRAIHDYWAEVPRTQDHIEFRYKILAVTADCGIARWRPKFVRLPSRAHVALDGMCVVSLNAQNPCTKLEEWWLRREPPGPQ